MPRTVPIAKRIEAIRRMKDGQGQRDIAKITGLSRPYLRKLAKQVGHKFPVNGVDIRGSICVCANCGMFMRRPQSKIDRAKNHFCDTTCKTMFTSGENNPNWKGGKSATTFSNWIYNQSDYKRWKQRALDRAGHQCEITGLEGTSDDPLDTHHILPKKDYNELSLDIDNALVVKRSVHQYIHKMIHNGCNYQEAIDKARQNFQD